MITFNFAQTPITQIADTIIIDASRRGVSDIHMDPRENGLMVRFRIDGDLTDYAYIPKVYERNLSTRLKLMSGMNITESRLPQDGAIKGTFGGKELDMRVSALPTNEGEKIVIRILDYSRSLSGLGSLGFNKDNYQKLLRMISNPNGIILVTGATGSGKSTTVYSVLQVLNKEETNIITVEDPIEMNIEGMNQVQVNSEIGLDFAAVLRSILRQDPNVILIGEIRDSETAQIAVRASITGHLVLSTIHTNSSLSTIERLLDMNVERYLLSSAISGIISQRLAKQLCPKCRIKRKTTPYEKKVFKLAMNQEVEELFDANKNGCNECNHGYKGRVAIHEVLEINDEIRESINKTTDDKSGLRGLVYGSGNVITMLQDALGKALSGQTTFEEVYRIIEIDNDIGDSCLANHINPDDYVEEKKEEEKEEPVIPEINEEPLPEEEEEEEEQEEEEEKEPSIMKVEIIKIPEANKKEKIGDEFSKDFYPTRDIEALKKKKRSLEESGKDFYPTKDYQKLRTLKKKLEENSTLFYPTTNSKKLRKEKQKMKEEAIAFYPTKNYKQLMAQRRKEEKEQREKKNKEKKQKELARKRELQKKRERERKIKIDANKNIMEYYNTKVKEESPLRKEYKNIDYHKTIEELIKAYNLKPMKKKRKRKLDGATTKNSSKSALDNLKIAYGFKAPYTSNKDLKYITPKISINTKNTNANRTHMNINSLIFKK